MNAPSQEEEKILALKTEIDNLKRFRKDAVDKLAR